jgi:hypothetical protein
MFLSDGDFVPDIFSEMAVFPPHVLPMQPTFSGVLVVFYF